MNHSAPWRDRLESTHQLSAGSSRAFEGQGSRTPFTQTGLPFAKGSHTSRKAAIAAAPNRKTKTARYLRLLAERGPLTDHEAHDALGGPLSGICSVRNGAVACGLVVRGVEERSSPWSRACATWRLTEAGELAAANVEAA